MTGPTLFDVLDALGLPRDIPDPEFNELLRTIYSNPDLHGLVHPMVPLELRFKAAVFRLISQGTYPSAFAIKKELGRHAKSKDALNGKECAWRRELLLSLGWTQHQPEHGIPGKFKPPSKDATC